MNNYQKGIAPLILLIIVTVVIGAGVGGYMYLEKKAGSPTPMPLTQLPAAEDIQSSPLIQPTTETPRAVPINTPIIPSLPLPHPTTGVPPGYSSEIIKVKFKQGTNVERPLLLIPQDLRDSVSSIVPLFSLPEGTIERIGGTGRLDLWFRITLKSGTDPIVFIEDLRRLDVLEIAEFAPLPAPPPISPQSAISAPMPTGSYIGLWKAEKLLGFNPQTQQWEEGKLLIDMFFEFKEDGTTCGGWSTMDGYRCTIYHPYTVSGDTIQIPKQSAAYKWKVAEGKLEITTEIMGNPFLRYISSPTTAEATKPAPKSDFTPPIVKSFEITVAPNPSTGKKEATLTCRATDDMAIKYIWINLQYQGDTMTWTKSPQVDDADPKDQTWTMTGFDGEKPGTHTARCSADDAAGNHSPEIKKTITIP